MNPSGTETEIYLGAQVNIIAAEALAFCDVKRY